MEGRGGGVPSMSIFVKDTCTYPEVLQHVIKNALYLDHLFSAHSSQFFLAYCDIFIAPKNLDFEFKLIIKSDF